MYGEIKMCIYTATRQALRYTTRSVRYCWYSKTDVIVPPTYIDTKRLLCWRNMRGRNSENTDHRMTWWLVWISPAVVPSDARCRDTPGKLLPAIAAQTILTLPINSNEAVTSLQVRTNQKKINKTNIYYSAARYSNRWTGVDSMAYLQARIWKKCEKGPSVPITEIF